jgi:hypothetical protein
MARRRKIIVPIASSADGFIGRSDGSVDWLDRPHPKGMYGIAVIPTFIGEGIPPARRTVPLKLISSRKFSDGVVKLHYAVGN